MRSSIVRIGNSQGLRIPKAILEACGIQEEVELSVQEGRLIVEPSHHAREGWASAAVRMAEAGDDELLDGTQATSFDDDEWEW